jgi:hypothetical protein
MHLHLLLLLLLIPACPGAPALPEPSPECSHPDTCTGPSNPALGHHARVANLAICRHLCRQQPGYRYTTYSLATSGPYPGACFLLPGCPARRPGGAQWVSAPRACPAPPHRGGPWTRDQLAFAARTT